MNRFSSGIHKIQVFPSARQDQLANQIYLHWIKSGISSTHILIITDSRHHASRFKKKVLEEAKSSFGEIHIQTFAGLAQTLVNDYYPLLGYSLPPKLLTGPEQRRIIQEFFPDKGRGFIQEVFDLIYRWEENSYTFEEIQSLAEAYERPKWVELYPFYESYLARLIERNRLDYGLLLHKGREVVERLGKKLGFTHLLFSEYQDINYSQFRIVEVLARHASAVVALGDEREAINQFRGASSNYFTNFNYYFSHSHWWLFKDEALVPWEQKDRPAYSLPNNIKVYWKDFPHYTQEIQWVSDQVSRLIDEEGLSPDHIAILYRSLRKSSLPQLTHLLQEYAIPFKVYGSAENLYQKAHIKEFISLLYFLARESGVIINKKLPPQSLFFSKIFGFLPRELKKINRILQLEINDRYIHSLIEEKDLFKIDDLPLRRKLERFQKEFKDCLGMVNTQLSCLVRFCWENLSYYEKVNREKNRVIWEDFQALFQDVVDFEDENRILPYQEMLAGFIEMVLTSHFSQDRIEEDLGESMNRVSLLPIHRIKGLCYKAVFILEVSEEILPQRYRTNELADPLLLVRTGSEGVGMRKGESVGAIGNALHQPLYSTLPFRQLQFEENERRLFYVGCNAATKYLFLSSSRVTPTQQELTPSRFKLEIASYINKEEPPALKVEPSIKSLEGRLRKRLGSDRVIKEADTYFLYQAADYYQLRLLTEGQVHLSWNKIIPTQPPESPFIPENIILSASKIQVYLDCPMKFKYSLLNLPEERPDAFLYGQMMHRILERLHHPEHPLPRQWDVIKVFIDELFKGAEFNYLAIQEYSKQRMEKELIAYLHKVDILPVSKTLRVEEGFELTWKGVRFRGRIDRIDQREDGSLELIDYKSSSTKMTKAEAQEDIQLGLYYLAFQHDEKLRHLGEVKRLSYWYIPSIGPRSDGKVSVTPDHSYLKKIQHKLDQTLEGIFCGKFPAKPKKNNLCNGCNYKELCPRFDAGVV